MHRNRLKIKFVSLFQVKSYIFQYTGRLLQLIISIKISPKLFFGVNSLILFYKK